MITLNFSGPYELMKAALIGKDRKAAKWQRENTSSGKNYYNFHHEGGKYPNPDWLGGISDANEFQAKMAKGLVGQFDSKIEAAQSSVNMLTASVSGEFFDTGAYVMGRPDCMVDFEPQQAPKFITLAVNSAVPANMSGVSLANICKDLLNQICTLEASGYRVKIEGVFYSDIKPVLNRKALEPILINYTIKEHQDDFSPSLHGFLIGHPAFNRIFINYLVQGYSFMRGGGYTKTYEDSNKIVVNIGNYELWGNGLIELAEKF